VASRGGNGNPFRDIGLTVHGIMLPYRRHVEKCDQLLILADDQGIGPFWKDINLVVLESGGFIHVENGGRAEQL